ncbi:MAG TPA: phenylalanine--tRNA ligase subunit beta [Solirubrobacteraceae bacterium]
MTLLRHLCDPPLSTEELAARLTMTGTKDERVFHHGVADPTGFVVGAVLDVRPHPDADRLRVCTVDVGLDQPSTIVCGAPNVAAGQTVAVARPGAVLPDGRRLKSAKLRGVVSDGMILSELELAVGTDQGGIIVLDHALTPGTPLAEAIELSSDVIEFEITPNRVDCLGVYGIAREVHASTGAPLEPPPWADDLGSADGDAGGAQVIVEAADLCSRFMVRAFDAVRIGPSPAWLKARLVAAGMRPISNVVDITNYVMLLTGQPLHAFDLDRVAGHRLVVRRAGDGEPIDTLDGQTRALDAEMVVICDDDGPTSIAGIMGGARSEVEPQTTRVLLEAATWDGANIQRSSTRLGLRSEASGRFEKGLEPEVAADGLAYATRLLVELCGARVLPGTVDVGGPGPDPAAIRLHPERVARLLGKAIGSARCTEILTALGFGVTHVPGVLESGVLDDAGDLDVTVPAFRRSDVTREVDLIEEVARIDGVDRLPATLPPRNGAAGRLTRAQRARRRAQDVLVGRGLHEVVGWSFTDSGLADRLRLPDYHPMRRAVRIENPLSEAQSLMRTNLLGSLLDIARHNVARGATDLALFESGTVYRVHKADELADAPSPVFEAHMLGGLLTGAYGGRSWRARGGAPPADFFTAKALVAAVLDTLGVDWSVAAAPWPFLHPGRTANVLVGGRRIGFVGEVHPLVAAEWGLGRIAAFSLNVDVIAAATPAVVTYTGLSDFPAVLHDLSVVVGDDVPAERVLAVVRTHAGPELAGVDVLDVYRGDQVGAGRVSLTLHLEFRAADRTLTDAEIADRRAAITAALAGELGGELRA